ncbi:hypothetical protein ACI3L0_004840 [Candidozyma auris]
MPRAKRLAACFSVLVVVMVVLRAISVSQLQLGDALYLTKNSIKEYRLSAICKSRILPGCNNYKMHEQNEYDDETREKVIAFDLDLDSPFTNVVNSVFPIDSIVSYNRSNETYEMIARYASFSPIISRSMVSEYAIVPGFACDGPLNPNLKGELSDKILIVLRGQCTFVQKISNLLNSELNPRAIIVANDEPYRALITMYSASFNSDGKLKTPILFISNENFVQLKGLSSEHLKLSIRTVAFDNWINLLLSMAVSPPLLILSCYIIIRSLQMCRKRRVSALNERIVKNLPVYIYHRNHLVPAEKFYDYLNATHQTNEIPSVPSSSEDVTSVAESDVPYSMKNFVINGTDLFSLRKPFGLLFAHKDFYPTFKCSICLDKFTPLQSRVLVLECHHVFHEKCLSNWLINFRRSCPLCNDTIRPTEISPLLGTPRQTMTHQSSFDLGAIERGLGIEGTRRSSHINIGSSPEVRSTAAIRSLQFEPASTERDSGGRSDECVESDSTSNSSFITSNSQPQSLTHTATTFSQSSSYFTPNQSVDSRATNGSPMHNEYSQDTIMLDGGQHERPGQSRMSTLMFPTSPSSSPAPTICMNDH